MEKETRQIAYDFMNILNDKTCAKSLYNRAYKHFLLKKDDDVYFANILGKCKHFKLGKTYNKNNIIVLPVQYDNETKKFNTSNDLIIDNFLTPIVSKLMNIVFNNNFKINFYNTFKYKYFIPILEAEYSRMVKEDLNYNNEKPFIICIESAISSFLIDENYVNSISDKILSKLKKSLKNFKFVTVSILDTKENIIYNPLKLSDYFTTTREMISKNEFYKITNNDPISVDVSNIVTDTTKDYHIGLGLDIVRFSIPCILDYILRMCCIEIIREYSSSDISSNVADDVIENIKNELFIYNSRTAKVIKDYLIDFKSKYDYFFTLQTEQLSYKLITDMFTKIVSDEKCLYNDDTIKTYQTQDPVSTSVEATTKLYSMISTIESMNRDYMKSNCSIVDINTMHGVFEIISKNMKNIVELRNEFFNLIYMNPDIFLDKWYPDHKSLKSYDKTENFFNHCVNLTTMYGKLDTATKENIINHLIEEIRCLYFKDHQFNYNYDTVLFDKENGFDSSKYTTIIEQVFSIIEKLSSNIKNVSQLYLENILPDIQHWSATMENNVRYYQFSDAVNEFKQYNNQIRVNNEDFDFYSFNFYKKN